MRKCFTSVPSISLFSIASDGFLSHNWIIDKLLFARGQSAIRFKKFSILVFHWRLSRSLVKWSRMLARIPLMAKTALKKCIFSPQHLSVFFMSVCLSVYLSICRPIFRVCLTVMPAFLPVFMSVCQPVCRPVFLPVCLPVGLPDCHVYVSAWLFPCLPAWLSCLCVCLPVCLSVCSTVCSCLSASMSACLPIWSTGTRDLFDTINNWYLIFDDW